ncbi:MAG: insulinase family protein [Bacteroidetes bacterium]|nr:MAG: insulinase family protein [Bacteroidota bacterium]
MEYQRHTLSNGIRIIHKHVNNQVAHCGVIINTGSRDETENEQGIAHFIEHTIFKGTQKRKAYHILSRLENVGGELNAYTTKEETCIYASFLKPYYERSIELFADISLRSIFPKAEIEKEKEVVIDEINSYRDNPAEEIFDEIEDLVFEGHSLGRNILGTKEQVRNFTRQNIFRFIKRTFNTEETVICSVGDIDFNKLVRLAEKYFGHAKANPRSFKREAFSNYKPKSKSFDKGMYQAHCIIANEAYSRQDAKRAPLILLNNVLGGPGLNTRLNMGIREKYGFCYNIESNYTQYSDTGIVSIYLGTDFGYLQKTISLAYKELKKLREQKLGSLQLQRAKQQMIGQIAISQESNVNELLSIGKSILAYDKVESIEQILKEIDGITASQLLDVANEVFDPQKLSLLIYNGQNN